MIKKLMFLINKRQMILLFHSPERRESRHRAEKIKSLPSNIHQPHLRWFLSLNSSYTMASLASFYTRNEDEFERNYVRRNHRNKDLKE